MSELPADLVPEVIGLIITPTAIAGCILLLGSRRPVPNALAFAGAFLCVYAPLARFAAVLLLFCAVFLGRGLTATL